MLYTLPYKFTMKLKSGLINLLYILLFAMLPLCTWAKSDDGSTLTGTVTDKKDGSPIPRAIVNIPDLKNGTATDQNGKHTLTNLPKGTHLIQVSFVGYSTVTKQVDFSKTSTLDIQLSVSAIEAGEVVITGVNRATELK